MANMTSNTNKRKTDGVLILGWGGIGSEAAEAYRAEGGEVTHVRIIDTAFGPDSEKIAGKRGHKFILADDVGGILREAARYSHLDDGLTPYIELDQGALKEGQGSGTYRWASNTLYAAHQHEIASFLDLAIDQELATLQGQGARMKVYHLASGFGGAGSGLLINGIAHVHNRIRRRNRRIPVDHHVHLVLPSAMGLNGTAALNKKWMANQAMTLMELAALTCGDAEALQRGLGVDIPSKERLVSKLVVYSGENCPEAALDRTALAARIAANVFAEADPDLGRFEAERDLNPMMVQDARFPAASIVESSSTYLVGVPAPIIDLHAAEAAKAGLLPLIEPIGKVLLQARSEAAIARLALDDLKNSISGALQKVIDGDGARLPENVAKLSDQAVVGRIEATDNRLHARNLPAYQKVEDKFRQQLVNHDVPKWFDEVAKELIGETRSLAEIEAVAGRSAEILKQRAAAAEAELAAIAAENWSGKLSLALDHVKKNAKHPIVLNRRKARLNAALAYDNQRLGYHNIEVLRLDALAARELARRFQDLAIAAGRAGVSVRTEFDSLEIRANEARTAALAAAEVGSSIVRDNELDMFLHRMAAGIAQRFPDVPTIDPARLLGAETAEARQALLGGTRTTHENRFREVLRALRDVPGIVAFGKLGFSPTKWLKEVVIPRLAEATNLNTTILGSGNVAQVAFIAVGGRNFASQVRALLAREAIDGVEVILSSDEQRHQILVRRRQIGAPMCAIPHMEEFLVAKRKYDALPADQRLLAQNVLISSGHLLHADETPLLPPALPSPAPLAPQFARPVHDNCHSGGNAPHSDRQTHAESNGEPVDDLLMARS